MSKRSSGGWSALQLILLLLYLILAAAPVLIAAVFGGGLRGPVLNVAGRWAGLTGLALMALQVISAARLKLLDRPFGLDSLMRVHRRLGALTMLLLLAHPVLLATSAGSLWLFGFEVGTSINLGKAGLALVLLAVGSSIIMARFGVDYLWMRLIHSWAAVIVLILGSWHAFAIGSDMGHTAMKSYWTVLVLGALLLFLFNEFWARAAGRYRYRVAEMQQETHDTWTLKLEPQTDRVINHLAGQFAFLTLQREGHKNEEHPFTISAGPESVSFTIKASGDYTATIGETKAGDGARLQGPYGRFCMELNDPGSAVFIAGGVGITPFLSMLRDMVSQGDQRQVVLIYANKTEADIICREELASLPDNIRVVHVLSQAEDNWTGLRGRVNAEIIRDAAGELLKTATFYVCGPAPMMKGMFRELKNLDVPRRRIRSERFGF